MRHAAIWVKLIEILINQKYIAPVSLIVLITKLVCMNLNEILSLCESYYDHERNAFVVKTN